MEMNFDATKSYRRQLEPGEYTVIGKGFEWLNSSRGDRYLKLDLQVVGGPFNGETISDRLHLHNSVSEIAVSIASQRLADFALACGVSLVQSPQQLMGKLVSAKLGWDRPKEYIEVKSYGPAPQEQETTAPTATW